MAANRGLIPSQMKTPLLIPCLSFMTGLVLARQTPCPTFAFLAVLTTAIILAGPTLWLSRQNRSKWTAVGWAVLAAGFLGFGGFRHNALVDRFEPRDIVWYAEQEARLVSLRGEILTAPYISESRGAFADFDFLRGAGTVFYLECEQLLLGQTWSDCCGKVLVVLDEPALHLRQGDRLEIDGRMFLRGRPSNPGERDRRLYHQAARCLVQVRVEHTEATRVTQQAPPPRPYQWLQQQLQELGHAGLDDDEHLAESQSSDVHAFAAALLLGRRHELDRSLQEVFVRSGTLHFLALSGLHVGVLAGFVWWLSRLVRLHRVVRGLICVAVIGAFIMIVPPRAPILRAGILSAVFCLAYMTRRPVNSVNVLALGALLILLWRPLELFMPGFQLSFVIVLGIIQFFPLVHSVLPLLFHRRVPGSLLPMTLDKRREILLKLWSALLRGVWGLTALSLVAWVVGLPLVGYHFNRISLCGVVASVVLSPVILLSLLLGFTKIALAGLLPTVSDWLGLGLSGLSEFSLSIASFFAGLPMATWTVGAIPAWWVWASYGLLLSLLWSVRRWRGGINNLPEVLRLWSALSTRTAGKRLITGTSIAVIWIGLMIWLVPCRGVPLPLPAAHVLNVGHGCCIVVEHSDGSVILYDAGSMSRFDAATQTIVPFLRQQGIARVDELYLSHANLDHYSSVIDLCEQIPVRQICYSPYFQAELDRSPAYTAMGILAAWLKQYEGSIRIVAPADEATSTKASAHDVEAAVLWPPSRTDATLSVNDRSIVLRLTDGELSMLFTGDAGIVPQQALLSQFSREQLQSDALLLPHHGAPHDILPGFIACVNPDVKISSGSRHSGQNHESHETIDQVFSTAQYGCISVYLMDDEVRVDTYHKPD